MDSTNLIENGKHFCILPWIHFHAWPDGKVLPCCVADSTKPVSKIKKDETIIQMLNSEEYKKMRLAMLNDEPVEACTRCYDLETLGTWTLRQSHNRRRGLECKDLVNATNDDGSIDEFKMKYMDIRFSNICNMKCRSCGPSCSSLWAQEFVENHDTDQYEHYFGTRKIVVNNNEDMSFMPKLIPYLKDVEEVYFAGGEILITPEHYECLDYWIDHGLSKKVELTYTTNLSSLKYKDRDLFGYWRHFPKLKIWASLDGKETHGEVIRKGTDWDRIVKNIRRIQDTVPHAEFQITPTLSIWNVWAFPKFFDYLIEEKLISEDTSPRFNTASHPWYANIMILPDYVKEKLAKTYSEYAEKYSYNQDIKNGFKMIGHTLLSGTAKPINDFKSSENKGGMLEFKKFNDDLDEIRNEKLTDVIPELLEVYEWAKS